MSIIDRFAQFFAQLVLTSFFVQLWQADIAFMIHKIVSIVIFLIIDEIPKQ